MNNKEILKNLGKVFSIEDKLDKIEHDYYRQDNKNKLIPPEELFNFYVDLDIARSLSVYDFFQKNSFNILVIDDNISVFEEVLSKIQQTFKLTFYKLNDFRDDIENIINGDSEGIEFSSVNQNSNGGNNCKNIEDFDLILLDIYFSGKRYSGKQILAKIKWDFPGMPVFIITKSHDIDNIKDMFSLKTEYFITKNRITGLPYFIYKFYINNFGPVLFGFEENDRKFLLRKITEWRRSELLLWHGDKAQNLVDHSFEHSNCMWNLFNRLYIYNIFPKNDKQNLLAFALSIWMHDIGHKGYEKILEPNAVRVKHSLISGELVYRYPEIYLGIDDKKLIEKIYLLSAFHKRSSPLNETQVEIIGGSSKIDRDFFGNSNFEFLSGYSTAGEILYLYKIDKDLVFYGALLRILDVIDKGLHRAGWEAEEDSKIVTVFEDAMYYIYEMEKEIQNLKQNLAKLKFQKQHGDFLTEINKLMDDIRKFIIDYYRPKIKVLNQKIRRPEEFILTEQEKQQSKDDTDAESIYLEIYGRIRELKNYEKRLKDRIDKLSADKHLDPARIKLLSEQIFFLLYCILHFYTHRSIKSPSIEKNNNGKDYKIVYYFNEGFINLPENPDFSFGDFNRILQEGWKVWSDIYEEYMPVKKILDDKITFEEVEFRYKRGMKEIHLLTIPLNEKFVETELKLKFESQKEMDNFIKILKNTFNVIKEEKAKIKDTFYDTPDNKTLRQRKWSLRERVENEKKVIWEIKIEPLYWEGNYEYRVELGPLKPTTDKEKTSILKNLLSQEEKIIINKGMIERIFNETILADRPFISYVQERISFKLKDSEDIEIFSDTITEIDDESIKNPLYLVEFEIKNGYPYEKCSKMETLKARIKSFFPEIEQYIYTDTKLDWALDIKKQEGQR